MRGTEKMINYHIFSVPQKLLNKRMGKEREHRRNQEWENANLAKLLNHSRARLGKPKKTTAIHT